MNTTNRASHIKPGALLFFLLLTVYLATANGRIDSGDGQAIFAVSQSLLENRGVSILPPDPNLIAFDAQGRPLGDAADLGIEDGYSIRGRDGRYYSPYGIGQSLLILPLLILGRFLASATWFAYLGSSQWVMQFVASMLFNPVVSAGSGLLFYLAARRLSYAPRVSIALAVIYACGTMTWVYAKSFFSDSLITLLLLLAFYCLLSYRYDHRLVWLWAGGASLGFAILTKPASLINAPVLIAYLVFAAKSESRLNFGRGLIAFTLPFIAGGMGTLAYDWWRYGSMLDTGYRNVGWTFPFLTGIYGLIASPGKGYLLYNPISLAAIGGTSFFWRRHKAETWVIGGIVAVNLLFLAKYDHWHGGGCWGPRLLLPITPFVILPLGSLLESLPQKRSLNLLLASLVAISIVIQIPGVFVNYARFLQKVYELSADQYYDRVTFQATFSPLIGQWGEMREVAGNLRNPVRRSAILQLAFQKDDDLSNGQAMAVLSANFPDFWVVYLSLINAGRVPSLGG
jgi:hypothetical protein